MACYEPLKGFRSTEKSERTGLPLITFNPLKAINSQLPILFPCGTCVGCRTDKREQWATRCTHEAQMHDTSSFITLTYANEHLPDDYSVDKRVWQLFMKRLRLIIGHKVRFFACGEYGDQNLRPHYHALIFGHSFLADREFHSTTTRGDRQYTSASLSKAWPYGRSLISDFEPALAGYVAGYVMKKIGGEPAATHYLRTHPLTGAPVKVAPEFALQSRNPGIGSTWFEKYKSDAFPSDFIVIEGRQRPVPQYYSRKLIQEELQPIQRKRKARSVTAVKKANNTPERLKVREFIARDRQSRRVRTLKDDDQ